MLAFHEDCLLYSLMLHLLSHLLASLPGAFCSLLSLTRYNLPTYNPPQKSSCLQHNWASVSKIAYLIAISKRGLLLATFCLSGLTPCKYLDLQSTSSVNLLPFTLRNSSLSITPHLGFASEKGTKGSNLWSPF